MCVPIAVFYDCRHPALNTSTSDDWKIDWSVFVWIADTNLFYRQKTIMHKNWIETITRNRLNENGELEVEYKVQDFK